MGLLRSSAKGGAIQTEIDVDLGAVDDVLKASKKRVRAQTKVGMKRAADIAVEPRAKRAAMVTMPGVVASSVTTKATSSEAYVTTRGPKLNDRIAGLLEFGGTVSTQLQPKAEGQTGMPIKSGVIRYTVNAPRKYTGKRAIRLAVAQSVPDFESILLGEIVDAFDPIPHVPK